MLVSAVRYAFAAFLGLLALGLEVDVQDGQSGRAVEKMSGGVLAAAIRV